MKEGSGDEADESSLKPREIKFDDPYNYPFLLDRINNIIRKNNTYSSKRV